MVNQYFIEDLAEAPEKPKSQYDVLVNRKGLVEVVAGRVKPGCIIYYDRGMDGRNIDLAMNERGFGVDALWANGMRRIPFKFADAADFQRFCEEVAEAANMSIALEPPGMHGWLVPEGFKRKFV